MNSSSFAGNVTKLVSGSIIAQSLGILVSPILTRLFAPEAFGIAALFTSITGIVAVISCLRYEYAIVLPATDEEAANLLCVCLISVLLVTSLSFLIISFTSNMIIIKLNVPQFKPYIWLVPLAVFMFGIFMSLNYWNIRTKHFGMISLGRITNSIASQTTKLTVGFAGYVTGGVLIGSMILGKVAATFFLASQIWKNDQTLFKSQIRLSKIISGFKRYKKFPMIDIWGGLLNTISWQLPALLLSMYFSPIVLGYYSLSSNVIRIPMRLIGGAIAQVFYQKASDTENKKQTAVIVENVFRRLVAIGLFPMLFLTLIGEDLFSIVFGDRWSEAGVYTQILSPWMFFTFISSPLATLFAVFERQGSALVIHTLILSTRFISLYVGYLFGNVYIALGLFSFSGIVVYGGLAIWCLKLVDISFRIFFALLFRYLAFFVPACCFVLFLKFKAQVSSINYLIICISLIIGYEIIIFASDASLRKILFFKKSEKEDVENLL